MRQHAAGGDANDFLDSRAEVGGDGALFGAVTRISDVLVQEYVLPGGESTIIGG